MTTPEDARPAVTAAADDDAPQSTEPDATGGRHAGARPRKRSSFWRELPFLVLIALVLALLIKTFLVQAFFIPSGSMEDTLRVGDRVLVNKLVYRIRDIHRGEIVVFKGPPSWQENPEFTYHPPSNPVSKFLHNVGSALGVAAPSSKDFIKRVIGVGGDHVVCCDPQGHITVNGVALDEPYLFPGVKPSEQNFDITVPKGHLWVMGDHRDSSADSRSHLSDGEDGTIPTKDIIGRAFVKVWPPKHWGTLPVPSTFHQKGLAALAGSPLALGFVAALPVTMLRRRLRRR